MRPIERGLREGEVAVAAVVGPQRADLGRRRTLDLLALDRAWIGCMPRSARNRPSSPIASPLVRRTWGCRVPRPGAGQGLEKALTIGDRPRLGCHETADSDPDYTLHW